MVFTLAHWADTSLHGVSAVAADPLPPSDGRQDQSTRAKTRPTASGLSIGRGNDLPIDSPHPVVSVSQSFSPRRGCPLPGLFTLRARRVDQALTAISQFRYPRQAESPAEDPSDADCLIVDRGPCIPTDPTTRGTPNTAAWSSRGRVDVHRRPVRPWAAAHAAASARFCTPSLVSTLLTW